MNFLLTSAGLTNNSIITALADLVEKPFSEVNFAFVPTAANIQKADKSWLIDDLVNCQKRNFKQIDIVDFSAIPKEVWLPRLEYADIILFGGGNTFHLMEMLSEHQLRAELPHLIETKVYVGISAGSMVTAPRVSLSRDSMLYLEETGSLKSEEGLGFVPFQIRPHLNSEHFPNVRLQNLEKIASDVPDPFYAIDDQTAIKVINSQVEVISEGEWKKFN